MAEGVSRNFPSPVLAPEDVRRLLTEGLAVVGAVGGSFGGPGGASGGASGAKVGARLFTKVTGAARTVPAPLRPEAYHAARDALRAVLVETAKPSEAVLVGFFPAGLNPAVIQLVWSSRAVEMTAHALEGLMPQRTALRALGGMEQVLAPYATSG